MMHSLVLLHRSGKLENFLTFFTNLFINYNKDKRQELSKWGRNKLNSFISSRYYKGISVLLSEPLELECHFRTKKSLDIDHNEEPQQRSARNGELHSKQ
jgi:hypothetical protein